MKSARFRLITNLTSNQVLMLSEAEFARYFDNRDPSGWSKPVVLFTADRPEPLSLENLAMLGNPKRICPALAMD